MTLPDIGTLSAETDILNDLLQTNNISLSVLRLDKIHPEITGNKFFKLYYFLQQAVTEQLPVITFGGAYSNHLYATAAACSLAGLKCTGIIRGEEPALLSPTLLFCLEKGMKLEFISREKYRSKNSTEFLTDLQNKYSNHILIPEGGYADSGAAGASMIRLLFPGENYTHICTAAGTATTMAGLCRNANPWEKIVGFSALRSMNDFDERMTHLNGNKTKNYSLITAYHFGGYARYNDQLIAFMNWLYDVKNIPTDFIYTGKMMFGVFDLINQNYFPPSSKILCIHTGGLQGNNSLASGILNF